MKLIELATIKNFTDAAADAATRGLTLGKSGNKTSVWVTDRYEYFRELSKKGFYTNTVDDIVPIKLENVVTKKDIWFFINNGLPPF